MRIITSSQTTKPRARVLIVDADAAARASAGSSLRTMDILVTEAGTGATAIATVFERAFDLALVNAHLPDVTGLGLMTTLRDRGIVLPWMLVGRTLTPSTIVDAMRLGALDALEWPFDVAKVVAAALCGSTPQCVPQSGQPQSGTSPLGTPQWPAPSALSRLPAPRSAAERWALLVLRGCTADHDLRTIHEWAQAIGVSYSALTDGCRLAGIRPHDARDFLRILRALFLAHGRVDNLVHGLSVNDPRTAKALFARAGLPLTNVATTIPLREFVARQRFVDPSGEPVTLMLRIIDDTSH